MLCYRAFHLGRMKCGIPSINLPYLSSRVGIVIPMQLDSHMNSFLPRIWPLPVQTPVFYCGPPLCLSWWGFLSQSLISLSPAGLPGSLSFLSCHSPYSDRGILLMAEVFGIQVNNCLKQSVQGFSRMRRSYEYVRYLLRFSYHQQ